MSNEVSIHVTSKNDTSKGFASVKQSTDEVASGFDKAGEAADGAEGKAQGFSDTLTGAADVMGGAGEIAKGNLFEGLVQVGGGMADLAGGMASFLIPAMSNFSLSTITAKAASLGAAAATKAQSIAQWALNAAMSANPIGLVIAAVVALVAIFLVLWNKSSAFREFWIGLWDKIKSAAGAAGDWIGEKWGGVLDFFKGIPGTIGSAMGGLADILTAPYRTAFNAIKSLWNSTVGGFGFSVPDWIPGVGGKSFKIPEMARGGIGGGLAIVGERGRELVNLPHGSQVIPNGTTENLLGRGSSGGGQPIVLQVVLDSKVIWEGQRRLYRTSNGAMGVA